MKAFFAGTRPARTVQRDGLEYDLPILYWRDDTMIALFSADAAKVRAMLPSENLHPIMISKQRCFLAMAVYNYLHTSIGPYGEWAMAVPVCFKRQPRTPLPMLLQSYDPSFGLWVPHIPVSTHAALRAGRAEWGYPKFIGNFHFESNPEYLEGNLAQGDQPIFDLRVPKRGFLMRDNRPTVALLVKDGQLVRSKVGSQAITQSAIYPRDAFLNVYPGHPMADDWLSLEPSKRPLMTQYLSGHQAILPEGDVLESGIRDWRGHFFENSGQDGRQTLSCNGENITIS